VLAFDLARVVTADSGQSHPRLGRSVRPSVADRPAYGDEGNGLGFLNLCRGGRLAEFLSRWQSRTAARSAPRRIELGRDLNRGGQEPAKKGASSFVSRFRTSACERSSGD
jgi:hypothetical protein